MRRILLIIAVSFSLFVTPVLAKKFVNSIYLEKVERTPAVDTDTVMEKSGVYKDPLITIVWDPAPRGFAFALTNESNNPFTIIWHQCFLSDAMNKYTIVHGGIKNINNMPPSTIASKKKLEDLLYPAAFARFVRGRYTDLRQKTIFKKKLKIKTAADFISQAFKATLAIQVGDTLYTYKFYFRTEAVEK